MYNKPMLSLDQAQDAIRAMLDEYNKDPDRRRVDMAVVDDAGNLLAYARMDGCRRPTFAIRKAYTAAIRGVDTAVFAEQLKSQGRSLEFWQDPQLLNFGGGVAAVKDGRSSRRHRRSAGCPPGRKMRPSPKPGCGPWAFSRRRSYSLYKAHHIKPIRLDGAASPGLPTLLASAPEVRDDLFG